MKLEKNNAVISPIPKKEFDSGKNIK